MKGYRFIPEVREPYEASQLATCNRCQFRWIHKFMTTAPGFAGSTSFDACEKCWDEEKQTFRHTTPRDAIMAQIDAQIKELKALKKDG
jgi:hypothetical protein